MLTKRDIFKINHFEKLNINHQRVFKHRLMKKCLSAIPDIEFVLLNHERIDLNVDRAIDLFKLKSLIETYENLIKLHAM